MFHETRFPTAISRASHGGPERRTDVVVLGSGAEERNARWADSRRSYNAGYGVKSLDDLHAVIAFFEERRGRLHGFRWRDPMDCKSCPPESTPTALDQVIGTGDGTTAAFQLTKTYGAAFNPWTRAIKKPVAGTVLIAVAEATQTPGTAYAIDHITGVVTFQPGHIPAAGQIVTAGFEFDVPVRFDTDRLEINLQGFRHGAIPSVPIVEIKGRLYQSGCDADLGDARCGVDLDNPAFRGTGTVVTAASPRLFTASGLSAYAAGWFTRGLVTFASGANAGRAQEVKRHALTGGAATLELWQPLAMPISTGDGFTVTAGCDKQLATCRARFANAVNFRGFPHMPGPDYVLAVAKPGEPVKGKRIASSE